MPQLKKVLLLYLFNFMCYSILMKKKIFNGFYGFIILYLFLVYMFFYWFKQYNNIVFAVIAGVICVFAFAHACRYAWRVVSAERLQQDKIDYVERKELEDKYNYYKQRDKD